MTPILLTTFQSPLVSAVTTPWSYNSPSSNTRLCGDISESWSSGLGPVQFYIGTVLAVYHPDFWLEFLPSCIGDSHSPIYLPISTKLSARYHPSEGCGRFVSVCDRSPWGFHPQSQFRYIKVVVGCLPPTVLVGTPFKLCFVFSHSNPLSNLSIFPLLTTHWAYNRPRRYDWRQLKSCYKTEYSCVLKNWEIAVTPTHYPSFNPLFLPTTHSRYREVVGVLVSTVSLAYGFTKGLT